MTIVATVTVPLVSTPAFTRILLIGYGQSNENGFMETGGSDANCPDWLPGTAFYDGTSITTVPLVNGIRILGNALKTVTGLDVLSLNGSVNGVPIQSLDKPNGTAIYTALLNKIKAVIQPTDRCFILFDQGEGNTNTNPPYTLGTGFFYWRDELHQLHLDLAADIGRTTATCPIIMTGLGVVAHDNTATPTGGCTDERWHKTQAEQFFAATQFADTYFHSATDFTQVLDGLHYDPPGHTKQALRYKQTILTLMGYATGQPVFTIASAATVDATHTTVDVTHNLGTDFSFANSGSTGDGWEISGNNGATWITASATRNSATQVLLTHSSISATSTRRLRYQYGQQPPGTTPNNPTTNYTQDNSSLNIPLTPTTWDVQPTTSSKLPVTTYRDTRVGIIDDTFHQHITGMLLGPENHQKFLILTCKAASIFVSMTATFTDDFGTQIGSAATATVVVTDAAENMMLQCIVPSNANAATRVNLSIVYSSNPFGSAAVSLWTVPFADMTSTTNTGTNSASISAASSGSCTVNVGAGGFVLALVHCDQQMTGFPAVSGDNPYALDAYSGSGIVFAEASAANCAASATSRFTFTGTFGTTPNLNFMMASWW